MLPSFVNIALSLPLKQLRFVPENTDWRHEFMKMTECNCPVCGCFEFDQLVRDRNRRDNIDCTGAYVECKKCSLIYLHERPPWDEIVKFYSSIDENQTANTGTVNAEELKQQAKTPVPQWKMFLRNLRFRPHSWPLESVAQNHCRLLDIGCGSGAKLLEFSQRGYDVWGVDVGEQSINNCKELLPQGHFIVGEVNQIDLPDKFFDFIRIDNALEHVPNPKEVIQECRRLLSHRGKLMIYVPHGKSLSMRFLKGNSISVWIPFHLQLFTHKSLRRLIEDAGLRDVRIYGYTPMSWLPLSIVQWQNRNKFISRSRYKNIPFWMTVVCLPIGWLAAKLGMSEELVAEVISD